MIKCNRFRSNGGQEEEEELTFVTVFSMFGRIRADVTGDSFEPRVTAAGAVTMDTVETLRTGQTALTVGQSGGSGGWAQRSSPFLCRSRDAGSLRCTACSPDRRTRCSTAPPAGRGGSAQPWNSIHYPTLKQSRKN